ncbi:MAG: hypothetical protein ACFFA8_10060 [Promethearchaeota archaeon]
MADIFNILIVGVNSYKLALIGTILRDFAKKSPIIKKVVDNIDEINSNSRIVKYIGIRYLIDNRIYSFEQNYSKEDLISPLIPMKDAHLIIGLDPLATYKSKNYISEKTVVIMNINQNFKMNNNKNTNEKNIQPSIGEIIDILDQLARRIISMNFTDLAQFQFNDTKFGDYIILGVIAKEFMGIFNEKRIRELISTTNKLGSEAINAFELGYNLV